VRRDDTPFGRAVGEVRAEGLTRLAVVGRLADMPNLGDHRSSDVRASWVITPLAGPRDALPASMWGRSIPSWPPWTLRRRARRPSTVIPRSYTSFTIVGVSQPERVDRLVELARWPIAPEVWDGLRPSDAPPDH
jgi:hypothetical protein